LREELYLQKELGETVFAEKEALIEKIQEDLKVKQENFEKETQHLEQIITKYED